MARMKSPVRGVLDTAEEYTFVSLYGSATLLLLAALVAGIFWLVGIVSARRGKDSRDGFTISGPTAYSSEANAHYATTMAFQAAVVALLLCITVLCLHHTRVRLS